jgi:hypothetical protein
VALGKLPVCPEKLQIVMAVTEALSQFLATANAFMEERKSEGHNTDQFPGDGHEKDSRNSSPSLPIDHWDSTDSGLCVRSFATTFNGHLLHRQGRHWATYAFRSRSPVPFS